MNEFEIMRKHNHPNALKVRGISCNDEGHPTISYEECQTNLKQSIQALSNVHRVYSIYKLAEGMKYVHSCKIFHVNLNPSYISSILKIINEYINSQYNILYII